MKNNFLNVLNLVDGYIQDKGIDILTTTALTIGLGAVAPVSILACEPVRATLISVSKDVISYGYELYTGEASISDLQNIGFKDVVEYTTDKAIEIGIASIIGCIIDKTFLKTIAENEESSFDLLKNAANNVYEESALSDIYNTIASQDSVSNMAKVAFNSISPSIGIAFEGLSNGGGDMLGSFIGNFTGSSMLNVFTDIIGNGAAQILDPFIGY